MRSRSLRRGVTTVLVGVLAVVGCSDHGDDTTRAPSATVRKEPPATTTSVVPVDRVPAVIDVAYVQAVIDALDRVEGDAVRALVGAREPNLAFYERIRALYLDPQFDRVQTSYGRSAAQEMIELRAHPEDPVTRIDRIIAVTGDCVFAAVTRDFGPILKVPPTEERKKGYIGFGLKKPELDPARRNPTAWMIGLDGATSTGEEPKNPCV
jgi:hypothetical protein